MNAYVVDCGVAAKWYIPETDSATAATLLDAPDALYAPAFITVEFANVLWKKVRSGDLLHGRATEFLAHFGACSLKRRSDSLLVDRALTIATRTGRTVYDCLYLALAQEVRGRMVTADRKLFNALAGSPYAEHLLWVGDVPSVP